MFPSWDDTSAVTSSIVVFWTSETHNTAKWKCACSSDCRLLRMWFCWYDCTYAWMHDCVHVRDPPQWRTALSAHKCLTRKQHVSLQACVRVIAFPLCVSWLCAVHSLRNGVSALPGMSMTCRRCLLAFCFTVYLDGCVASHDWGFKMLEIRTDCRAQKTQQAHNVLPYIPTTESRKYTTISQTATKPKRHASPSQSRRKLAWKTKHHLDDLYGMKRFLWAINEKLSRDKKTVQLRLWSPSGCVRGWCPSWWLNLWNSSPSAASCEYITRPRPTSRNESSSRDVSFAHQEHHTALMAPQSYLFHNIPVLLVFLFLNSNPNTDGIGHLSIHSRRTFAMHTLDRCVKQQSARTLVSTAKVSPCFITFCVRRLVLAHVASNRGPAPHTTGHPTQKPTRTTMRRSPPSGKTT